MLHPFQAGLSAQPSPYGYVRATTRLAEEIFEDECYDNYGNYTQDVNVGIQYFDGLGRPTISVDSTGGMTSAKLIEYDMYGRINRSYLQTPIGTSGSYITATAIRQASIAYFCDNAPYIDFEYDGLGRQSSSCGAGMAWRNAGARQLVSFGINQNEEVRLYEVLNVQLRLSGYYANGLLEKTIETDEDGRSVTSFTDMEGNIVLVKDDMGGLTYYVRDEQGRLRYVLPPNASCQLNATGQWWNYTTNTILNSMAYYYGYDIHGRCVVKKKPGASPQFFTYDKSGRLVFFRDGNLIEKGRTMFFLSDCHGRTVLEGLCQNTVLDISNMDVVASYSGQGGLGGYSIPFQLSNVCLTKVFYYDNYNYMSGLGAEGDSVTFFAHNDFPGYNSSPKGKVTGQVNYLLEDSTRRLVTALYYDSLGQVTCQRKTNILGGTDTWRTRHTYTHRPLKIFHLHTAAGRNPLREETLYNYDAGDRLSAVRHCVNGSQPIILAEYTYNDLGRIIQKEIGGSEAVDYRYNVRGWPIRLAGDKFTESLTYNSSTGSLTPQTPLWGGDISAMTWNVEDDERLRGYQFIYDGLRRLTDAFYGEGTNLTVNRGKYDEHSNYDIMGNPTWISRKGRLDNGTYGYIDRIRLDYEGNQLSCAEDSVGAMPTWNEAFHFADGADETVEYEYDANGNMTRDLNRNISSIQYNLLNLPTRITFANYMGDISYTYSAMGEKLAVQYLYGTGPIINPISPSSSLAGGGDMQLGGFTGLTLRDGGMVNILDRYSIYYCDNVVYDHGIVRLLTDEGYVTFSTNGTPTYHFYVRDHLGNVRVVFDEDWDTEQVTHYYPFGGIMAESSGQSVQPWKYGGKELDRTHGLDAYDFGARTYFADRMQWGQMDPLCEKYYNISPYAYCGGNPVNRIDPDGRDEWEINIQGQIVNRITTDKHDAFFIVDDDNKRIEGKSISFKYGFVKMTFKSHARVKEKGIEKGKTKEKETIKHFDVYETRGDANSTKLFEFLADNTTVEWSQMRFGVKGGNGLNVLTTSHIQDIEYGSPSMLSKQYLYGYHMREHIHSHPQNTPIPSGFGEYEGTGDMEFARYLQGIRPNVRLKLYIPRTNLYINYDRESTINDF